MNWFKMLWLTSEEREILRKAKNPQPDTKGLENAILNVAEAISKPKLQPMLSNGKPYQNIIFSSGNLTVVMHDSTILDKTGVDRVFFEKVRNCNTQTEIEDLMIDRSIAPPPPAPNIHVFETEEERQMVTDNLDILRNHKDFNVGEYVIMKGVNLPIPAIVLASFIEILEKQAALEELEMTGKANNDLLVIDQEQLFDQYQALKMFWLKLALNPLPQSREDLLVFCRKNNVRITNNGNLVLYRRIVSLAGANKNYIGFISQSYYTLKKKGEDTRNYAVGKKDDVYFFVNLTTEEFNHEELIGNLQVLYYELPTFESNKFTASHDRNMSIKIGGIYRIPEDKINLNNTICAAGGLHAAAVDYNYSGFGDTMVVVLVNPSKAITVPLGETGKLRTTEMFIACINDKPQGKHFDEDALASFDDEYHDLTLQELEQAAESKSFGALSVQENVPAISLIDLNAIKNMLKNRIKKIV